MPTLHLSNDLQDYIKVLIRDTFYPIGKIYMSVDNVNPGTIFGGTWIAWGTGRVPVGINTSDTDFNTVEKTGGSKYLQSHTHEMNNGQITNAGTTGQYNGVDWVLNGANWGTISTKSAGDGNSGNLQPYITCYMWKRTA